MMEDFPGYDSQKRFNEHGRHLKDLAAVLATPEGFRLIADLLRAFGIGCFLPNDAGAIAIYNEGERLLREAARADAAAATRLMAAMRGLEI